MPHALPLRRRGYDAGLRITWRADAPPAVGTIGNRVGRLVADGLVERIISKNATNWPVGAVASTDDPSCLQDFYPELC